MFRILFCNPSFELQITLINTSALFIPTMSISGIVGVSCRVPLRMVDKSGTFLCCFLQLCSLPKDHKRQSASPDFFTHLEKYLSSKAFACERTFDNFGFCLNDNCFTIPAIIFLFASSNWGRRIARFKRLAVFQNFIRVRVSRSNFFSIKKAVFQQVSSRVNVRSWVPYSITS